MRAKYGLPLFYTRLYKRPPHLRDPTADFNVVEAVGLRWQVYRFRIPEQEFSNSLRWPGGTVCFPSLYAVRAPLPIFPPWRACCARFRRLRNRCFALVFPEGWGKPGQQPGKKVLWRYIHLNSLVKLVISVLSSSWNMQIDPINNRTSTCLMLIQVLLSGKKKHFLVIIVVLNPGEAMEQYCSDLKKHTELE